MPIIPALESKFMEIFDICAARKKEISNLKEWKQQEPREIQGANSLYTPVCQGTPPVHAK